MCDNARQPVIFTLSAYNLSDDFICLYEGYHNFILQSLQALERYSIISFSLFRSGALSCKRFLSELLKITKLMLILGEVRLAQQGLGKGL